MYYLLYGMVFIALRHGQSVWNKLNILAGWNNVNLSELGKKEAINASHILKKYKFDYVFTSDLQRTIDTCNIIKKELGQEFNIIRSDELKERNYGLLSGKTKEELEKIYSKELVYKWKKSYWGTPPEGENLNDVKYRIGNYYEKNILPLINSNKNILLISHSNTLRAFFVYLKIKNEYDIEQFKINNCIPINININDKTFYYEK